MKPKEVMQMVDVIHAQAPPLLADYRLDSDNVATALQALEDLHDTLEYAFADIEVLQGYERKDEQDELRRDIEFRHNVMLGRAA